MANTYTQLYIHIVFTVAGRQNLIPKQHKDELYKYITGIIQSRKSKLLAIGGMPDHIHIFIGMNPEGGLSDLVRDIKAASSGFIHEKKWLRAKFNWQKGYGAFSYSRSQIQNVCKYIMNQEKHHSKITFKEEHIEMLKKFGIEFDEKYLFKWIE
ncbi:MAG: transposase [Chlorobiaceae bacterium]|nr:transposase [Chlorobiaceae bacterium]